MTDVYISYAPEDRAVAADLAAAMDERGWSVFWDLDAAAGEPADPEAALAEAACIVALWSPAAVGPGALVVSEASEAARRSALVSVLVEDVKLPRRLRKTFTVDFRAWTGTGRLPELDELIAEVERRVTVAPLTPADRSQLQRPLVRGDVAAVPENLFDGKVGELAGHTGEVYDLAWAPGGLLLATASADGTARLWDAKHLAEKLRIAGHGGEVNDVAFSPEGTMLATACDDGVVRLWDAPSGAAAGSYEGHGDIVFWVGFSPDGDVAASAGADRKVHVWRVRDRSRVWSFDLDEEISTARFLDATVLMTADDDGDLVLWDLESGDPIRESDVHEGQIADIAVSPTGALVASGSDRGEMAVFNLADGSLRWWGGDMAGQVYGLAFSPDGRLLAASDDEGVTLFRADDGEVVDGRSDPGATRLEFSPTGAVLALASGNTVKVVTAGEQTS